MYALVTFGEVIQGHYEGDFLISQLFSPAGKPTNTSDDAARDDHDSLLPKFSKLLMMEHNEIDPLFLSHKPDSIQFVKTAVSALKHNEYVKETCTAFMNRLEEKRKAKECEISELEQNNYAGSYEIQNILPVLRVEADRTQDLIENAKDKLICEANTESTNRAAIMNAYFKAAQEQSFKNTTEIMSAIEPFNKNDKATFETRINQFASAIKDAEAHNMMTTVTDRLNSEASDAILNKPSNFNSIDLNGYDDDDDDQQCMTSVESSPLLQATSK